MSLTAVSQAQFATDRSLTEFLAWASPELAARHVAASFGRTSRVAQSRPSVPAGVQPLLLDLEVGSVIGYVWGDPERQQLVILSHGWNGWGLQLAPIATALAAEGYAVLAFDHVGHGRSPGSRNSAAGFVATLRELVARFPTTAAIIGHSLGGTAAAYFSAASGGRLPMVVIAAPAEPRLFLNAFLRRFRLSPAVAERARVLIERRDGLTFDEVTATRFAPRINAPLLVIQDRDDREVPIGDARHFLALAPDAALVETAGQGDNRVLAAPTAIRAAVGHVVNHAR